jgi:hypothetical protein
MNHQFDVEKKIEIALEFVACSLCFHDHGLQLQAEKIGIRQISECQKCLNSRGKKITREKLWDLAYTFFCDGSKRRWRYGGSNVIQLYKDYKTEIEFPLWLKDDVKIFESVFGIGFGYYGPSLWMIGEIEPLKDLQNSKKRSRIITRIINAN